MAIPIPEISETPLGGTGAQRAQQLREAGFTPRNPNVSAPGMSREAQAWRDSLRTPTAPTATTAPSSTPYRIARNVGGALSEGLRDGVSLRGLGTAAVLGAGVDQGMRALNGTATPTDNYQRRFGLTDQQRESLGDVAVRLPGVLSDVAADVADVPLSGVNLVRKAFGAAPLPTFGEILRKNDLPPANQVYQLPPQGVQSVVDRLGPDYSNEGRNYPTPSVAPSLRPPDLSGHIIRNGNNYSGSNIKFGEDILDKNGKLVNGGDPNNPKGFGVTSLDTSAGYRADLAELGRLRAEAAERAAGFAANQPGGGLMGFSPRTLVDDVVARHGQSGGGGSSSPRLRERIAMAELAERRAANQAATAATLRGQDVSAATAREGNAERRYATDVGASTARYGHDLDYREKIDARLMDLAAKQQLRDSISAAASAGRGSMRNAAAVAAAHGLPSEPFVALDRLDSDNTAARAKALDKAVEAQSVDPVTGKVSEGQLALNRSAVKKTIRGLDGMSPEQLAAVEPEVNSVAKLRNGFNALRRTSLTQRLGLSNAPVESDELPDLTGYTPKRLGKTANWDPTIDAKQGDWELSHPSKPSLYLPGSVTSFDADMLAKYRGLRLPPN